METYMTAFGVICLGVVPYLLLRLYKAGKAFDSMEDKYVTVLDVCDRLRLELQKKEGLIGRYQSKRNSHKQEVASWTKQKYNLKQKIKELEGDGQC